MDLRTGSPRSRALVTAAAGLLALALLHDLDHMRQGRSLPAALVAIGTLGTLGAFGLLVATLRGRDDSVHRLAAGFGLMTALGLVVIHVLPNWSPISDPYGSAGVDWLSWISLGAFISGGIALAWVAYRDDPPR